MDGIGSRWKCPLALDSIVDRYAFLRKRSGSPEQGRRTDALVGEQGGFLARGAELPDAILWAPVLAFAERRAFSHYEAWHPFRVQGDKISFKYGLGLRAEALWILNCADMREQRQHPFARHTHEQLARWGILDRCGIGCPCGL
jgi:hypothetical protein